MCVKRQRNLVNQMAPADEDCIRIRLSIQLPAVGTCHVVKSGPWGSAAAACVTDTTAPEHNTFPIAYL